MKQFSLIRNSLAFCLALEFLFSVAHASVYLDGSTVGCTDGLNSYNPATRSCGSGSDTVYTNLTSFSAGIVAGATNFIRAGSYFRDAANGSLQITKAGTDNTHRTIVRAYPGEELRAIIGTAKRGATYNSNPADPTGAGSWLYYPNSVLRIDAPYVTVYGLKVYGQTYFYGAPHVIVDSCDLGGGGPSENQGQVVKFKNTFDSVLRNSLIHHSTGVSSVEGPQNGSAVMGYASSWIVENCTFYDNWGSDIRNKDGLGQAGRTVEVRYNFFGPSSIYPQVNGFGGFNQYQETSNVYLHHNIFYRKNTGIDVGGAPANDYIFYQNTFINCVEDITQAVTNTSNPYKSYNNLFHHSMPGQLNQKIYYLSVLKGSDWNLYSGSGGWQTHDSGSWVTVSATLNAWQSFSGLDASSIVTNPNFVNADGSSASGFKRSVYGENFTGSPYGARAGAYSTGSEPIGASLVTGGNGALLRPSAPRTLMAH